MFKTKMLQALFQQFEKCSAVNATTLFCHCPLFWIWARRASTRCKTHQLSLLWQPAILDLLTQGLDRVQYYKKIRKWRILDKSEFSWHGGCRKSLLRYVSQYRVTIDSPGKNLVVNFPCGPQYLNVAHLASDSHHLLLGFHHSNPIFEKKAHLNY